MVTITISADDEIETEFRERVYNKYGKTKGILKKAFSEAMNKWIDDDKQEEIKKRQMILMHRGFKSGKRYYKKREDIYERRLLYGR